MEEKVLKIIVILLSIGLVIFAVKQKIFGDSIAINCAFAFIVGMNCMGSISDD